MESEHSWLWGILVHISDDEAKRIARGERKVLRKVDPWSSNVQGAAVFCERCQRPFIEAQGQPCFQGGRARGSSLVLPEHVR